MFLPSNKPLTSMIKKWLHSKPSKTIMNIVSISNCNGINYDHHQLTKSVANTGKWFQHHQQQKRHVYNQFPRITTTNNNVNIVPRRTLVHDNHHQQFVPLNDRIHISKEVFDALHGQDPVVSLESTIITHGMKYPNNLQTALKVESIIRKNGAIPATIGIIDGTIFVGLQPWQLELLANCKTAEHRQHGNEIYKVSRGDLAAICQMKRNGGTTVSATSYISNLVGIKVFVTGGIGGVHRGAEITMDISADLMELSRTPIAVISAGIKSILDVEKTLEVLETNGVCIAVFNGTINNDHNDGDKVELPAFYTANSGLFVNYNFHDEHSVAHLIYTRDQLGLDSAILLAVPNYTEQGSIFQKELDHALQIALNEARDKQIKGKDVTPYLLSRISLLTNEKALKLNQELIENNAHVGANVALHYSDICKQKQSSKSLAKQNFHMKTIDSFGTTKNNNNILFRKRYDKPPVVIGGSIIDIITKVHCTQVMLNGSTYDGSVYTSLGGVARNITDSILRMGLECLFITAVGVDQQGQMIATNNSNMDARGIRFIENLPTSAGSVTIDSNGECLLVVADMRVHQMIDQQFTSTFEKELSEAPIVITDANVPNETLNYVYGLCCQRNIPVWFEPTDLNLADKLFQLDSSNFQSIKFISPNFNELQAMFSIVSSQHTNPICKDQLTRTELIEITELYGRKLLENLKFLHSIIVTIDKHGIVYIGPEIDFHSCFIKLGPNSNLFTGNPIPKKLSAIHLEQEEIKPIINVSGAGDCLVGATIYGLVHGRSLKESLQLGLKAAKLSVSTVNTVPDNIQNILS